MAGNTRSNSTRLRCSSSESSSRQEHSNALVTVWNVLPWQHLSYDDESKGPSSARLSSSGEVEDPRLANTFHAMTSPGPVLVSQRAAERLQRVGPPKGARPGVDRGPYGGRACVGWVGVSDGGWDPSRRTVPQPASHDAPSPPGQRHIWPDGTRATLVPI